MKYILPMLVVLLFTSCSRKGANGNLPYDMPPTAPIPPTKYCFEQNNGNGGKLELIIKGDSAFGKFLNAKSENSAGENFTGVIYGSVLIVKYKFKSDTGWISQDQEWKMVEDSIYKTGQKQMPDSLEAKAQIKSPSNIETSFYKTRCK